MSRFRRINLLVKQGIWQLEALMFFRAGVEDHQRTGAETFELADVMLAKPALFVAACESTCRLPALLTIDMKVNRLLADWTLREKRVNSPPNQQLYELHNPHIEMSHG